MALYENSYIFLFIIFLTFIRLQAEEETDLSDKLAAAVGAADGTLTAFLMMFDQCVDTHMSQKQFLIDDIQKFVNYPAKTTVGLAPKFTGNRKFFANMITTTAFKDMLAKDTEEIWKNLIKKLRLAAAVGAADGTLTAFLMMFDQCVDTHMSQKQFLIDDIQKFVNYPAKTTVGLAPKFTGNRKFFANMITTTAFKDMLAKDTEEIWKNLIKKLRYCDEVVMDQQLLKEFYDREVDQSKL